MLGSLRITRLRAAGAFFIAVLALIPVLLSGGTAHAASFAEIQAYGPGSFCITALNPTKAGSELVLGVCASAESQEFSVKVLNGSYVELQNYDGLCITFDMANGGPDGAYALLGNCVGAQNQIFEKAASRYLGYNNWYMPDRVDNLGRHVALDNEGGNNQAYNHIDESYYSSALASEAWTPPSLP
jgi:hypothetical protein